MGIEGIENLKPEAGVWNGKINPELYIKTKRSEGKTRHDTQQDLVDIGLSVYDARRLLDLFWENNANF